LGAAVAALTAVFVAAAVDRHLTDAAPRGRERLGLTRLQTPAWSPSPLSNKGIELTARR